MDWVGLGGPGHHLAPSHTLGGAEGQVQCSGVSPSPGVQQKLEIHALPPAGLPSGRGRGAVGRSVALLGAREMCSEAPLAPAGPAQVSSGLSCSRDSCLS